MRNIDSPLHVDFKKHFSVCNAAGVRGGRGPRRCLRQLEDQFS